MITETVEERKRAEADRVPVRAEMKELQKEVSEAREALHSSVSHRDNQRSSDLDGVRTAVT